MRGWPTILVLGIAVTPTTMAQDISVTDILDKYDLTQAQIARFVTQGTTATKSVGGKRTTFSYEETDFSYDGNRINHRYRRWPELASTDVAKDPTEAEDRSYLWDDRVHYEYRKEVRMPAKLFIGRSKDMNQAMISMGYSGAPLMGIYLADHENVGTILRKAKSLHLRPQRERLNDSACYVIDANTEHGQYTVWIDPEHGYNIAQAQVQKKQGDLAWGRPLGWVADRTPPNIPKADPYTRIAFALRNVRFENIGGLWVPMEADYENVFERARGTSSSAAHHKRTSFTPNPDFDALHAFTPQFPDGTQIWVMESPGIQYEWHNGAPVPIVDQKYLSDMDRSLVAVGGGAESPEPSAGSASAGDKDAKEDRSAPLAPPAAVSRGTQQTGPSRQRAPFVGPAVGVCILVIVGLIALARKGIMR